jgi:hypothetical protein
MVDGRFDASIWRAKGSSMEPQWARGRELVDKISWDEEKTIRADWKKRLGHQAVLKLDLEKVLQVRPATARDYAKAAEPIGFIEKFPGGAVRHNTTVRVKGR